MTLKEAEAVKIGTAVYSKYYGKTKWIVTGKRYVERAIKPPHYMFSLETEQGVKAMREYIHKELCFTEPK